MSTVTGIGNEPLEPAVPRTARAAGRILPVFRLQFVNRWSAFVIPWLVLAFIFLVNFAIWLIIVANVQNPADRADAQSGLQFSGASFYVFVYLGIFAAQAIAFTFPFALGYSTTRREYYLGTALAFAGMAALYAVALTVLSVIETATGGWGVGGQMFSAVYFGGPDAPWWVRLFIFFSAFAFFLFLGSTIAAVYMRWRNNGMLIFFAAAALIVLGLVALATFTNSWPLVGEWFVANGAPGVAAWLFAPTVLSALAGYLVLSRATPKN
ncbi:hypothetical protein VD659_01905 [Herbiconiux sp. 11R-BC]|uniref:hypothetical protein n=1 Tax=Herbiconiux sp. 11R-BC TaxID=3111637 RepID=UPI003C08C614